MASAKPRPLDLVLAYRAAKEAGNTHEAQRLRVELLTMNEGLVRKFVMRYARPQTDADLDDAMQAGRMGLLRTLEDPEGGDKCFDPSRGKSFSTYAAYWIRDHIQRWAGRTLAVTRPRSASMPASIARLAARHRLLTGKEPTAADLGVTEKDLDEWSEGSHFVYIDEDATEEHGRPELTADAFEADHVVDRAQIERYWDEATASLSTRNREIADAFFWEGEGQQVIAERFGISQGFVSQIVKRVEERLKRAVKRVDAPSSSKRPIDSARAWAKRMQEWRQKKGRTS